MKKHNNQKLMDHNKSIFNRPGVTDEFCSGVHAYIPNTSRSLPKFAPLILTEGEFKAMALAEAGYSAIGLCGINGGSRSLTSADGGRDHTIHEELVGVLKEHQPACKRKPR